MAHNSMEIATSSAQQDLTLPVLTGATIEPLPDVGTWGGLVDAWIGSHESERTRAAYTDEITRWMRWCAVVDVDPAQATRPAIEAYARHLADAGEAAATRARRLSAISSAYAYAVSIGAIDTNPVEHVRRPTTGDNSSTVGLTRTEAVAMLIAAEAESSRTHTLIALLLGAGLRVSEAVAARVEDLGVDRGHRFLTVHGKGGHHRRIPLNPPLLHALDRHLDNEATGYILATRSGRAWDRSEAWRAVRRIAHAAGITAADKISPHSMRHTAATLLLADGAPLTRVQDLLGHADPRTTQRYNRQRGQLDGSAGYTLGHLLAEK